jgi:hypothetical protein
MIPRNPGKIELGRCLVEEASGLVTCMYSSIRPMAQWMATTHTVGYEPFIKSQLALRQLT